MSASPHWWDFLFGKGALDKAAQQGAPAPAPQPQQPASVGISQSDIAAMAQQQADQQRALKQAKPVQSPPKPLGTK